MPEIIDSWNPAEVNHFLPFGHHRRLALETRFACWKSELERVASDTIIGIDDGHAKSLARFMEWESGFFGNHIWKLEAVHGDLQAASPSDHIEAVERRLLQENADYVYSFVPAEATDVLEVMGRRGWSLVEPRILFYRSIEPISDFPHYAVIKAGAEDVEPLSRVAIEAGNSFDRFSADPFFPGADVDRLMAKWVENSIVHSFADCVLRPEVSPDGFMMVRHHKQRYEFGIRDTQYVFAAILPVLRGWLMRLISEGAHISKDEGAEGLCFTTQFTNRPLVRIGQKMGFYMTTSHMVMRKILT